MHCRRSLTYDATCSMMTVQHARILNTAFMLWGSVADGEVARSVSATRMPVKLWFLASPAWVS